MSLEIDDCCTFAPLEKLIAVPSCPLSSKTWSSDCFRRQLKQSGQKSAELIGRVLCPVMECTPKEVIWRVCYQNYFNSEKSSRLEDAADSADCQILKKFEVLCPKYWIDQWNEHKGKKSLAEPE